MSSAGLGGLVPVKFASAGVGLAGSVFFELTSHAVKRKRRMNASEHASRRWGFFEITKGA